MTGAVSDAFIRLAFGVDISQAGYIIGANPGNHSKRDWGGR
jgi:hypothetical protein